MEGERMSIDETRVRAILAAYGAEPARWPETERQAVRAFLSTHGARVADAAAEACEIDAALSLAPAPEAPSEDLSARVLATAPGSNVVPLRQRRIGGFDLRAVGALAACALIGVVLGFGSVRGDGGDAAEADAAFGDAFALVAGGEG